MATESLIVELDARTKKLDAKLLSTNEKLDRLAGKTEKADGKLSKLSSTAKSVGSVLGVTTVAVGALTAGTVALIKQTTQYSKELKIASKLSGIAAEEFQKMAFATSTVGIGIEKLGDISKDTREKIGDFLNTGGGGFQDFADAMKLTKEEAKLVADEFSHLSGPEILQEMVTRMEDADVSFVQMSHALEGMASDTTNLIPLLKDSGKEMKTLSDAMAGVTVPLTDDDLKKLEDLDIAIKLASESASSLATKTLVDLSDWFINAANAASFFFASLNEGTRADLQTDLLSVMDDIAGVEERLNSFMLVESIEKPRLEGMLSDLIAERDQIEAALAKLDEKAQAPEMQKTVINGDDSGSGGVAGNNIDKIQEIEDRFKTEEQLLTEKLERELQLIGDNDALKADLHEEYLHNIVMLDMAAEEEKLQAMLEADSKAEKARKKQAKDKAALDKIEKKNAQDSEKLEEQQARNSMMLAELVFKDNKEVSAGIAFVNTAQGITKALAVQDYAGAALTGVLGAAQISAILGAGKGGGSAPGVSSSGPSQSPQQTDFAPETSSLELTEQSEGQGITTQRLIISTDDGTDIFDTFARGINENNRNGG